MGEMKRSLLFKKGAEASLYLADWHGRRVVLKKRLPKKYRPTKLDERIRVYRTIHEPQLMNEAKKAGVSTPTVFLVDVKNATIIMEYVEGRQVKRLLGEVSVDERERLCTKIGEMIGRLHEHGLIHGDLTTSNMILDSDGKVFFVDFGLGEKNIELEAKGVDLHLMKRALESAHFQHADQCLTAVITGYGKIVKRVAVRRVLDKIKEIERRGRYVAERKEQN